MNHLCDFSMCCNLCEKNFNSATSLFCHLSQHVKTSFKKNKYKNCDDGLYSNISCDVLRSRNGSLNTSSCNSDNTNVIVSLHCQDSTPSAIEKDKSFLSKENEGQNKSDLLSCGNIEYSSSAADKNGLVASCKTSIDKTSDELLGVMDPSEYCVTCIDERENTDKGSIKMDVEKDPLPKGKSLKIKKKYMCEVCFKLFSWSTDLKRHILSHTGERPFKCNSCEATFTRNFLLQKHLSKVHPCHVSKEKMDFIEKRVALNLKLLRKSFNDQAN